MKDNKLIKILIPIIAVIVVFESIVLVSNLDKTSKETNEVGQNNTNVIDQSKKDEELPVADFVWETKTLGMEVGKSYDVTLNLVTREDVVLDSIEAYIYYDPQLATVSKLVTNKEIGEELKTTGLDAKTGLVAAVLWSNSEKGVGFNTNKDEVTKVLSFTVTPKVEGVLEFDLSTNKSENKLESFIIETDTTNRLVYSINKLEINVIK